MNELLIDGRVAAQEFGLIDHDIARLYRGGMDDDFAQYSPGILLMCHLMENLRGKGVHEIDMGRGREEYKLRLGGQSIIFRSSKVEEGWPRCCSVLTMPHWSRSSQLFTVA